MLQASEMPHHAKHHASENRRAIERSLVIAMHTQHEPRRGSVMIIIEIETLRGAIKNKKPKLLFELEPGQLFRLELIQHLF